MHAQSSAATYQFADFVLNLERGCLQRNGSDLELRPKAFAVLRHLVEHAGKLLSKDELVNIAWPDVIVSDDSLAQCMRDIRKLLDDQNQRFIKTVPRRGYIFIAEVSPVNGDTADKLAVPAKSSGLKWPALASVLIGCSAVILLSSWGAELLQRQGRDMQGSRVILGPITIMASGRTVLGQSIAYPAGEPELTASSFVLWPGQMTDWHIHSAPRVIYVLEGTLTIDYGSKGIRRFEAGEVFIEPIDWPHKGNNFTNQPVRLLVLNVGARGVAELTWASQR